MTGFSAKSECCASDCQGLCEARGKLDERVVTAGLSFQQSCNGCPLLRWQAVSHGMTPPKICAHCFAGHRASSDDGKALRSRGIKAMGLGPTSLSN